MSEFIRNQMKNNSRARRVVPPKRPPPLPSWFPPPSDPVFLHTRAVLAVIAPTIVTFRVLAISIMIINIFETAAHLVIIILLIFKAKWVIFLVPVEAVVLVVVVGAEASSEPSRGGQLAHQVGSWAGDTLWGRRCRKNCFFFKMSKPKQGRQSICIEKLYFRFLLKHADVLYSCPELW